MSNRLWQIELWCQSVARSLGRSITRSLAWSLGPLFARSLAWSLARSFDRPLTAPWRASTNVMPYDWWRPWPTAILACGRLLEVMLLFRPRAIGGSIACSKLSSCSSLSFCQGHFVKDILSIVLDFPNPALDSNMFYLVICGLCGQQHVLFGHI